MMESSDAVLAYRTGQAWTDFWKLRGIWQAPPLLVDRQMKLAYFNAAVLNLRRAAIYHDHTDTYRAADLPPLSNVVKARRLSFVGHQLRLDLKELAHIYALYEPPAALGHRKRGRQAEENETNLFH